MKSDLAQVQGFNYLQPCEQAQRFPPQLLQYQTLQEPVPWVGGALAHGGEALTVATWKTEKTSALSDMSARNLKGRQILARNTSLQNVLFGYSQHAISIPTTDLTS